MDNNNMDGIEWERVTVDKSLLERYDKLKSQADELARALEFCLGREVFPKGVCEADKETEAFTVASEALSNYRKGE